MIDVSYSVVARPFIRMLLEKISTVGCTNLKLEPHLHHLGTHFFVNLKEVSLSFLGSFLPLTLVSL